MLLIRITRNVLSDFHCSRVFQYQRPPITAITASAAWIEEEGLMNSYQYMIEKWMAENRHRMVQCPYQPGRLLISEKSCGQRQLKAKKENLDDVMSGDVFDYMYKKGLSICLTCNAMRKAKAA
jgi:hypothetical protein